TNDNQGDPAATVTAATQGVSTITVGSAFTTGAGGTLTLNANGSYTYTPPAWNLVPPAGLTEVFNYTITDADGDTSSTTLTITVNDANRVPTANPDTNAAEEGGSAVTGSVMSNDIQGDPITTVTAADRDGHAIVIGSTFHTA